MHFSRVSITIISIFLLKACKQPSESASDEASALESHSSQSQISGETSLQKSDRIVTKESTEEFSLESWHKKLSQMSAEDLKLYKHEVRQLLLENPEQAKEIFSQYTDLLFQELPAEALNFALTHGDLLADGAGDQISTKLLQSWRENDSSAFQNYLHSLAKHYGGTEVECNHALRLLMSGEKEDFSPQDWVAWVDLLSKGEEGNGELQGAALNTMLSLIDPANSDHLSPLVEAYQKRLTNKGMQKHLPEFASIIAKHSPKESQWLLETMPGGSYREEVLERTIAELGRSHPEIGAEWLSSQDILKKIFRPEFDVWKTDAVDQGIPSPQLQEAEEAFQAHVDNVFDKTLETYIFSIVHQHPEDAVENIDSLIDPARRESLRKKVQAILDTF